MKIIAITFMLLVTVTTASEAGRWKVGSGPSGSTRYTATDGTVCYWANETGTNQCRWKTNNGCKFTHESGPDQCSPNSPTSETKTFTTTKSEVTIKSYDDGDNNIQTRCGTVTVKNFSTDDNLTFNTCIRTSSVDPTYVKHISSTMKAVEYTSITTVPATTSYPAIYRNLSANTWQIPGPPPGGATCSVAWQQYTGAQYGCYIQTVGTGFAMGMWRSIAPVSGSLLGCLRTGTLAGYAACVAAVAGGSFVSNVVGDILYNPSGPPTSACNAADQARAMIGLYCQ